MSEGSKSSDSPDRQHDAPRAGRAGEEPSSGPAAAEDAARETGEQDQEGEAVESGGNGAGDGENVDEASLAAQLEAARTEVAEQKDRYMRAAAEAENIRRRAENDIASARKYAVEGFAAEVLAVRDSLEIARSLEINEDDAGAVAKMKEGLDLTLKQLDSTLSKFSIEAIDPQKGDKLDPEKHQAMSTQESDNVPPNHILSVIQKGYTIHGRLLRPAMVVVAKKPQDGAGTGGETA